MTPAPALDEKPVDEKILFCVTAPLTAPPMADAVGVVTLS